MKSELQRRCEDNKCAGHMIIAQHCGCKGNSINRTLTWRAGIIVSQEWLITVQHLPVKRPHAAQSLFLSVTSQPGPPTQRGGSRDNRAAMALFN